MNGSINLLIRDPKKQQTILTKRVKKARLVAVGFLFLVGTVSAGLFLLIASSGRPQLLAEEARVRAQVEAKASSFEDQVFIRNQLVAIDEVLASRPDLTRTLSLFQSIVPADINVSQMSIGAEGVFLDISTSSLASLQSFFTTIQESAGRGEIPTQINSSGISYAVETGSYTMTVTFNNPQ